METEFSKPKDTINTKNCLYCNIPFTEKLFCKECINSLKELAENGDKGAMFNLANCYKNGEGTEKNLDKAFYWYQKAVENGNEDAIFNLAICYRNGEGTEKNLEKAFYWYQRAAENAFHWYQKAAENENEKAMLALANCYYFGKGTEKNLEKFFYWNQKAAESGLKKAMNYLASCYYNGDGIEKDLDKAFHWYQKASESVFTAAMHNLAICYENGNEMEKDLDKAFHWYQKRQKMWCQQCNVKRFQKDFSKWTSKNESIDKFIQEAQLNAKNSYEILEWIPYNELSSINYHDKGGFSEIHKAIWSDGPIFSWNYDKQQWNRQTDHEVILKVLNDSSSLNNKFLDEWKYHHNCQKKSFSKFIQFFGITQDPNNLNYMIVMSYAKKGNLRKCLSKVITFKWQDKLQLLKKIILGLKVIHESNLTHGDFLDGNILMSGDYNELFIIDLGLCKPISDLQDSDNNKVNEVYGVLPYMAPEILRNKPYTTASDIYSFSMIMLFIYLFILCEDGQTINRT
ncbi:kinase-like domain-containing protein [Rhizophagus irregularis DAOM 181602=DAOM 197198]|nr:kinase-like domain-containing protein [Rhizophagus irregularis DAOM 181602=DAOM 197198]